MTPQSHFMIAAPIAPGREAALRAVLDAMNVAPGHADPLDAVLPFGAFDTLHFARLVVLGDAMLDDLERFGLPRPDVPHYLAFMGDCDGPADILLRAVAQRCGDGLRRLFAHCVGFDASMPLFDWLRAHDLPVAVRYVNFVGRTVVRVREESALQKALSTQVGREPIGDPQALRLALLAFVRGEVAAGRLTITPVAPTPFAWALRNLLHAVAIPLAGLALLPLVLLLLPVALVLLRLHETRDPEYCPRPDPAAVVEMQRLEDHDPTNSFTALGPVKPGWFRGAVLQIVLVLLDFACRHVFDKGYLTRVQTIHFARWVFLDDRTRMLFASSYDGSHESYMDDFINKVGWGLNLVFSNGFGWPRTDWLVSGGARHEMAFKHYQRRHQLPTQVWYKAYPGLTLHDLDRNQRIRAGVEAPTMTASQTVAWLRLL